MKRITRYVLLFITRRFVLLVAPSWYVNSSSLVGVWVQMVKITEMIIFQSKKYLLIILYKKKTLSHIPVLINPFSNKEHSLLQSPRQSLSLTFSLFFQVKIKFLHSTITHNTIETESGIFFYNVGIQWKPIRWSGYVYIYICCIYFLLDFILHSDLVMFT